MIFTWIFNFGLKITPKGPPATKDPPLGVGMTLAHQPMVQILISLTQTVHYGWEQPLIIPDFGIFKVCAIRPTLLVTLFGLAFYSPTLYHTRNNSCK